MAGVTIVTSDEANNQWQLIHLDHLNTKQLLKKGFLLNLYVCDHYVPYLIVTIHADDSLVLAKTQFTSLIRSHSKSGQETSSHG